MEQYEISPRHYFQEMQKVLKHFKPELISVRFWGALGGKTVLYENLKGKKLVIIQEQNGIKIRIDGKDRFYFEIVGAKRDKNNGRDWAFRYERIDKNGLLHYACAGYPNPHTPYTGPDDPKLPSARKSILCSANSKHFIKIIFPGKIPIKRFRLMPG